MNNLKNNIRRTPLRFARRKLARVCKPSSLRLSSKLLRLFPTTTDENLVFNDALGTTVGAKKDGKYSAAALTAFGEDLSVNSSGESSHSPFPVPHSPFFTGKPYVEGLGHAFLMRNYRASLSKWQTADPLGYPDGWNQLAYCGNWVTSEEWEEWADIYKYSKVTATMTKGKAFDLSESAVLALVSAGVGIVSAAGGVIYGMTFDKFRDVIRAVDGNNVTIVVGDSYLSLGRQCIDTGIDVRLVE